jgi:hypothetical protein
MHTAKLAAPVCTSGLSKEAMNITCLKPQSIFTLTSRVKRFTPASVYTSVAVHATLHAAAATAPLASAAAALTDYNSSTYACISRVRVGFGLNPKP